MKLPRITNKQQEILELLYQYRFLNRIQIQVLMGHKDKKRISAWLKDLRENHYIEWIYNPDHFAEKTKPAIYFIAINGVRYLKTVQADDDSPWYPLEDVRKRYREHERSQTFIDHSLLVADCCINLRTSNTSKKTYLFVTEADYGQQYNEYNFLSASELVQPDICFVKKEQKGGEAVTTAYLLEIFDATLPRYRLKKRLGNYIEYLNDNEWQSETGDDEPPIILLVCPKTTDLIYGKRRTRGLMADIWDYEDEDRPNIRFATIEKVKLHGVIGKIWEEA